MVSNTDATLAIHLFVAQGPIDGSLKINPTIQTVTKCEGRGDVYSYIDGFELTSVGNGQYWIDGMVRVFDFLQLGACSVEFYVQHPTDNYMMGCIYASNIVTERA